MKWREDDTIRFYRDVPDKRGVSELVINTPPIPPIPSFPAMWLMFFSLYSLRSQRFLRWFNLPFVPLPQ